MKLNRRTFAGISAAPLVLTPEQVRGAQANSAITAGLIGCGSRGTEVASIFARHDRVRFTALCDVRPEQMDRTAERLKAPDARRFRDHRELLQSGVDAVLIASPVFLHPEHLESAILAGKHIYCEKPMGADVAGCLRVIRAAAKASPQQSITVGFQNRYGPGYLKAEKLLRESAIGTIKMARSNWIASTGLGKRKRAPVPPEQEKLIYWGAWRQYSGDFIVEQDCHGVDVLNWFLGGAPLKAHGTGGRILRTYGDNLDHLNVTYTYPSGVQAALTATQFGPNGYRVVSETFIGTEGVIETQRQSLWVYKNQQEQTLEKIDKNITENAVEQFIQRVIERRPENTAVRSAESTLSSILGRIAIDRKHEVTWKEMLAEA
ncbi:MAG: Gfo/Idh/MocA family oxidoreductase [Acidobacteria bacterium]|nr:Gfo/Idh/MocA family oxidoreductase [Acidobacteriota bacterium]